MVSQTNPAWLVSVYLCG